MTMWTGCVKLVGLSGYSNFAGTKHQQSYIHEIEGLRVLHWKGLDLLKLKGLAVLYANAVCSTWAS